jgi:hypothetical protein
LASAEETKIAVERAVAIAVERAVEEKDAAVAACKKKSNELMVQYSSD